MVFVFTKAISSSHVSIPGKGKEMFLVHKTPRPILGTTQTSIQWVPRFLYEVKRPRSEAEHTTLFSAEVKNEWSYTSVWFRGVDRENFTFDAVCDRQPTHCLFS